MPALGLRDSTAGEIVLAARPFLGGRSTVNRVYFNAAMRARGREAEEAWRYCLQSGDLMAHYGLGYTLHELGRSREAYRHLRAYTELVPADGWAWSWLGKACEAMGEAAEARSAYARAIALDGDATDAPRLLAELDRGRGPGSPEGSGAGHGPAGATGEDPTDLLIRGILRSRRGTTGDEVGRITGRISGAPFMGEVRVPPRHRGLRYGGRRVGVREDSLFYHLAKRVDEGQWAEGTTEEDYLEDLRSAARDPSARLVLYTLRGGNVAAVLSDNTVPEGRRGPYALDHLFVAYSADRATIITGYQVSGVETLNLSEDPLWLR